MADDRDTARPGSPRPAAPGPPLWARALAAVTRSARRRRTAGGAAVCASACEARARSIGRGGPAAATGRLRRGDASPGGTDPRERAQEAVESRTTGPDDLASLLDMLDLRRRGD
ncbi:hypothetical protein [Streptomyces sp. NBC_00539]|uniref:hypothetical protein n=1 Tax=Streptomyces sp. NBC_00539 TaxID=2975770 RepID=UPI002E821271|nr:hypothetical protein [Streptomyces sp. NBC_00539]WUC67974.1 hypothetical protein OG861_29140 [Streptomyces sp. NBC_00539]